MVNKIFPTDYTLVASASNDYLLLSDTSNANNAIKDTVVDVVNAGLSATTTDVLPEGATNRYMTNAEKTKLASVQMGAQVNQVNQVNGQQGNVLLNLDMIPDGISRKAGSAIFDTAKDGQLSTAWSHSQIISGNPHGTTAAQIGLGNVTNDEQLSTTAGNFSALPEKPDVQQHLADLFVLQDSSDSNNIKSVSNETMLIWHTSMIQVWGSSINYYKFTFTNSTTYDLRSIVFFGGNIYLCTVSHQSSGSFAADLGLGYWSLIGSGGGGGGNVVNSGSVAPVVPGVTPGDLYIDYVSGILYYWDGSNWIHRLVTPTTSGAPVGAGTTVGETRIDPSTGNIYVWNGANWTVNNATGGGGGGINYNTGSTIGDRLTKSVGIGADLITETGISVDGSNNVTGINNLTVGGTTNLNGPVNIGAGPLTYTNTVTTGTQTFNSGYAGTYADNSTLNMNGDINYGATSVQNYTAGSVVGGDVTYTDLDATYDSNSSIVYNSTPITNNGNTITYTGATNTGTLNQNNLVITNTNVDTTNDSGSSITNNGNTITNTGITQTFDSTSVTTQNGTTNYGATSVQNYVGGSTITGTVINNANNTYGGTNTFTDLNVTNLTATNITQSFPGSWGADTTPYQIIAKQTLQGDRYTDNISQNLNLFGAFITYTTYPGNFPQKITGGVLQTINSNSLGTNGSGVWVKNGYGYVIFTFPGSQGVRRVDLTQDIVNTSNWSALTPPVGYDFSTNNDVPCGYDVNGKFYTYNNNNNGTLSIRRFSQSGVTFTYETVINVTGVVNSSEVLVNDLGISITNMGGTQTVSLYDLTATTVLNAAGYNSSNGPILNLKTSTYAGVNTDSGVTSYTMQRVF